MLFVNHFILLARLLSAGYAAGDLEIFRSWWSHDIWNPLNLYTNPISIRWYVLRFLDLPYNNPMTWGWDGM